MPGELLNIHDVAFRLGRSKAAVRHLVQRGRIPCVRVDRRVQFEPAAIDEWLRSHNISRPPVWTPLCVCCHLCAEHCACGEDCSDAREFELRERECEACQQQAERRHTTKRRQRSTP